MKKIEWFSCNQHRGAEIAFIWTQLYEDDADATCFFESALFSVRKCAGTVLKLTYDKAIRVWDVKLKTECTLLNPNGISYRLLGAHDRVFFK